MQCPILLTNHRAVRQVSCSFFKEISVHKQEARYSRRLSFQDFKEISRQQGNQRRFHVFMGLHGRGASQEGNFTRGELHTSEETIATPNTRSQVHPTHKNKKQSVCTYRPLQGVTSQAGVVYIIVDVVLRTWLCGITPLITDDTTRSPVIYYESESIFLQHRKVGGPFRVLIGTAQGPIHYLGR